MVEFTSLLEADDLVNFLRIATVLKPGDSLREIAERIEASISTVSKQISRIENNPAFPKLFDRTPGVNGGTQLTEDGDRLFELLVKIFRDFRSEGSRLSIACSENLITNRVLSRVFFPNRKQKTESQLPDVNLNVELHLAAKFDFATLLSRIEQKEIDIACLWGTDKRMKTKVDGIVCETLDEYMFDLVFISNRPEIIAEINRRIPGSSKSGRGKKHQISLLQAYAGRQVCVTLGSDSQPGNEIFELCSTKARLEPVKVDTFDAATAVVRSRVADLALIPAIYPNLLRLRGLGEIHFSDPCGEIPVALFYLKSNRKRKKFSELIASIRSRLVEFPRKTPIHIQTETTNSLTPKECLKLRYGYYVDYRREEVIEDGEESFQWGPEEIQWMPHSASDYQLNGVIENHQGHTFNVSAEIHKGGLVIKAVKSDVVPDNTSQNCVRSFISVFTLVARNPLRLIGTWTSVDDGMVSVYATVFSENELSINELKELQASVNFRSILAAKDGAGFLPKPTENISSLKSR